MSESRVIKVNGREVDVASDLTLLQACEAAGEEIPRFCYHGENQFGAIFAIDATNKESGERSPMREFGLYTVENGKIAREEFFYLAG